MTPVASNLSPLTLSTAECLTSSLLLSALPLTSRIPFSINSFFSGNWCFPLPIFIFIRITRSIRSVLELLMLRVILSRVVLLYFFHFVIAISSLLLVCRVSLHCLLILCHGSMRGVHGGVLEICVLLLIVRLLRLLN